MDELIQIAINAAIEAGKAILNIYDTDFEIEIKKDNSPLTTADNASHHIIDKALVATGIPILSEEGKHMPYAERKNWKQFWLVDPLDGTKEFIKKNGEFTVNIAFIDNKKTSAGIIYVPVTDELFVGVLNEGAYKLTHTKGFNGTIKELKQRGMKLPMKKSENEYVVVASRSHLSAETASFIEKMKKTHPYIKTVSKGSSLKLCLIAEGSADVYPRFAPTSEWDIAAGHAIVKASGGQVVLAEDEKTEVNYNKENILNPWFIAKSGTE